MIDLYCTVLILLCLPFLYSCGRFKATILGLMLFYSSGANAQVVTPNDTISIDNNEPKKQIRQIDSVKVELLSDSDRNEPPKSSLIDTTVQNKYGDLLNDDIRYNRKYPLSKAALGVLGINVSAWALDRFVYDRDYSRVNLKTWKYNIKNGWEWDNDPFGVNFIGHPYSGSMYFNAARARGYSFIESVPLTVLGSLIWEYFGENTRPSYNDIINTPINGIFLGEILYRLSSNILDDRIIGRERIFREIIAGLVDPERGFNRLLQGKSFRRTTREVYQKEPLNITLLAGIHKINEKSNTVFSKGPNDALINLQFDYGNPFEIRHRKPYDFFRARTAFSFGFGGKFLDNITGYGLLSGRNTHLGKISGLYGAFQYFDYWDNQTFVLGAVGFGGGLTTKYPIGRSSNLYTNAHLALVPLAGNTTRFGPDTTTVRDYTYNDGFEGTLESTLNLGKHFSASLAYHYYVLHTFVGPAGSNYINILNPRITVNIYKNMSIGFEHFVYYNDRYLKNFTAIHSARTEQKIFFSLFFEDPQRRGRYN